MEKIFVADVTEAALDQANQLLGFLVDRVEADWRAVLTAELTEAELDINIKNVTAALVALGLGTSEPKGAIPGGTGQIKANAGLSGEDSQRAIRLLKRTGRLVQAGKGRGKALVLISAEPLDAGEFATMISPEPDSPSGRVAVTEGMVSTTDISGLLRAIRDAYRSQQEAFNNLIATSKTLQRDLDAALAENRELSARILALGDELDQVRAHAAVSTWS